MRVGLISCCKQKLLSPAPAERLYCSTYFQLSRDYVEPRTDEWGILSAKHGLVLPDQLIEPYDLSLDSYDQGELELWAEWTSAQIRERWNPDGTIFMTVLGGGYCRALWGFPMVEDAIYIWTERRRRRGIRKPYMGIGMIQKALKEGWCIG